MHTQSISSNWTITDHARMRMSQRNISINEIEFVVAHGQLRNAAGAVFFTLRGKDIPKEFRHESAISRLEGTTVVASRDSNDVITVYRNRDSGLRQIKHKA